MQAYKALFHHKKGFIHVPAIFFLKFIDINMLLYLFNKELILKKVCFLA